MIGIHIKFRYFQVKLNIYIVCKLVTRGLMEKYSIMAKIDILTWHWHVCIWSNISTCMYTFVIYYISPIQSNTNESTYQLIYVSYMYILLIKIFLGIIQNLKKNVWSVTYLGCFQVFALTWKRQLREERLCASYDSVTPGGNVTFSDNCQEDSTRRWLYDKVVHEIQLSIY